MPRITVPLASSYDAINRPVALGVARDVMTLCAIDQDTPIYLTGEFEQLNQPGTNLGQNDEVRFESHRRMVVTAEDNYRQESMLNIVVRQNEFPPFIEDRDLGFSVRGVYAQSDIQLNFKYTCATRHEAIKWRDEFAVRRAENRSAITHEVSYNIPLHDGLLALMAHLHELKENIAGYGEDFPTYFNRIQRRPIQCIGALDGDHDKLLTVIPEKQVQLTGWFDFTDIPKEQKVDGNSTWEITFTYNVSYYRCLHLYVVYPLMVHQQHIRKEYYDSRRRWSVEELPKLGAIGIRALDSLDGNLDNYPPYADGIRLPQHDEWIPSHRKPDYTVPGCTWMIALSPTDPSDVLDLMTIPAMRLSPEIEAYFRTYHKRLCKRGASPALFTLFCDDMPMTESLLYVDEALRVRTTVPLDLRRNYHLRLSFPTKYSLFDSIAIRSMQENAIATLQIFQTILPQLDVEDALTRLFDGKYLTVPYIEWFYSYLRDKGIGFADQPDGYIGQYDRPRLPGDGSGPGANPGRYVQFLSIFVKR